MSGLHVEVTGSGPPIMLLHGWAMHGGVFGRFAAHLAERHTVHCVDLPGHGHSRASPVPLRLPDTVAAVLAVAPARARWIGWSLGGLVALQAALARPQAVQHLAVLCASPCFVRTQDWPHGVSAAIFDDFADGLRPDPAATLERFIALEAFGSEHARDDIRLLRRAVSARGQPSAQALAEGLHLLKSADLRAQLPALRMPSLWLAGQRDRLVTPAAMAAAASLAPQARQLTVPGTGHAPFLGDTAAIARAVLDFQRQCTG